MSLTAIIEIQPDDWQYIEFVGGPIDGEIMPAPMSAHSTMRERGDGVSAWRYERRGDVMQYVGVVEFSEPMDDWEDDDAD